MSGFLSLMNAGEEDIAKLSGAIDNCNGAAKNMADIMNDNLEGQLTILKSQLQEVAHRFQRNRPYILYIFPIAQLKKPRCSPLQLRSLNCTLGKIS